MAAEGTCKIPIGLAAALLDTGVSPADVLATARLPSRLLDIPGRYCHQRTTLPCGARFEA